MAINFVPDISFVPDEETKASIPGAEEYDAEQRRKKSLPKESTASWLGRKTGESLFGVPEAALNTLGGAGGALIGPIPAILKSLNEGKNSEGFDKYYTDIMRASGTLGTSLMDLFGKRTEVGDDLNEFVGNVVNQALLPMMGHYIPYTAKQYKRDIFKDLSREEIPQSAPTQPTQRERRVVLNQPVEAERPTLYVGNDSIAIPKEQLAFKEMADTQIKTEQQKLMTNESQQLPLFDQPEMGRVANPYEAKLGDWRVDENGIPIKADLSMEAANMEQPLQRSLWGDELPQTYNPVGQAADLFAENGLQQGLPLTEAIDSMPWAQRRGAIKRQLSHDLASTPELDAAIAAAERRPLGSDSPAIGPGLGPNGRGVRRGAISADQFYDGLRGLNRWLSKLTEQPWVARAFPSTHWQTNPDGTPLVLLHATQNAFEGVPETRQEGLHAGYASAPHFRVMFGRDIDKSPVSLRSYSFIPDDVIAQRWPDKKIAFYPIVIKKGNYPVLGRDYGTWYPHRLAQHVNFFVDFSNALKDMGKDVGYYNVKDAFEKWSRDNINKKTYDEYNPAFAKFLKDAFDVDGFFYKNEYENAEHLYLKKHQVSGEPTVSQKRQIEHSNRLKPQNSFVTWNDKNIASLYDITKQHRGGVGPGKGMGGRGIQRGAVNIGSAVVGVNKAVRFLEESFPIIAKILKRRWVSEMVLDINKAYESPDYTQYWMEKLAGVTSKEDPTLGGQLHSIGRNTLYGQAKGPKDIVKLTLTKKERNEAMLLRDTLIELNQRHKQEYHRVLEPQPPNPDNYSWSRGKDPFSHDERMKNPQYAKDYRAFEEAVDTWNQNVTNRHEAFAEQAGFEPSGFYKTEFDYDIKPEDVVWDIIFGIADTVRKTDASQTTSSILNRIGGVGYGKGMGGRGPTRGAISPIKWLDKLDESVEKWRTGTKDFSPEGFVSKAIRDNSYIPKGAPAEEIIKKALTQSDGPELFKNLQSGLRVAGEKSESPLMIESARWINWADRVGIKAVRERVDPIEKLWTNLSSDELTRAASILVEDQLNRSQQNISHLTPKVQNAINALRIGYHDLFNIINQTRQALGKKPISAQEAYFASQWRGNWHLPVKDVNGKLTGYVRTNTKYEAWKAHAWIKKNHPDWVLPDKPEYKNSGVMDRVPKDVFDIYEGMLQVFKDTPMEAELKALMEEVKAENAFSMDTFNVHFQPKMNARFFLGDRPWLSGKENAKQGMRAQIDYLKDGHRWAPMQEAMAELKKVLSNEELAAKQPNNMEMTQAYVTHALGGTHDLTKPIFNGMAKALGVSPASFARLANDLKSFTYAVQLGWSGGYWAATPLQSFILGPSEHLALSNKGYKGNYFMSFAKAAIDSNAILMEHMLRETFGKHEAMRNTPMRMSALAKDALRYMEDNGVINATLWDEVGNIGEHQTFQKIRQATDWSINNPERVARLMAFMSFVHHLEQGGMRPGLEMFKMADELTKNTLTSFSRLDRPLIIPKTGAIGELGYTYKSPMVNYYNQLSKYAMAYQKNPTYKNFLPLIMAGFVMPLALGGVFALPFTNELDQTINLVKKLVANTWPEHYPKWKDFGLREYLMENLPEILHYGTVSSLSGVQLASRFTNQVIDPEKPLGAFAPVGQEIIEQKSIASFLANPSQRSFAEGVYANSPPMVKGNMETSMDVFKQGPRDASGHQAYFNPNSVANPQEWIKRTSEEEFVRRFGVTALSEAKRRDARYISNQSRANLFKARESSMNKFLTAIVDNNPASMRKYAIAYVQNHGDESTFDKDFNGALEKRFMTPEERQVTHTKNYAQAMDLVKLIKLNGGKLQ